MAFGKNPHVARAQAAEQKAADAEDDASRARALRDAAHQWDRAAEREQPGKRRSEYEQNATKNRALADAPGDAPADDEDGADQAVTLVPPPKDRSLLN